MTRESMALQARSYGLPVLVLAVTWVVLATSTPTFRGEASVFSVLEGFPLLGLVALGLAATVVAGELDLSVGSMAALAGVIAVKAASLGLVGSLLLATAVGCLLGALQGGLIAKLQISSLVLTIGTLILLRGVTYIASASAPVQLTDFAVSDPLLERYGIFSLGSIVAIALFVAMGMFLTYTRYGREIYAIGGARQEAHAAGVPRIRPMVCAFAISGACAALAGALASLKGGSAAPQNYEDVLLAAAAAVLLGGVSLYGGRGTVLNVALGVAVLSAVSAGLAARGSDASVTQLVTGTLLVAIVAIEFAIVRFARRSSLRRAGAAPAPARIRRA